MDKQRSKELLSDDSSDSSDHMLPATLPSTSRPKSTIAPVATDLSKHSKKVSKSDRQEFWSRLQGAQLNIMNSWAKSFSASQPHAPALPKPTKVSLSGARSAMPSTSKSTGTHAGASSSHKPQDLSKYKIKKRHHQSSNTVGTMTLSKSRAVPSTSSGRLPGSPAMSQLRMTSALGSTPGRVKIKRSGMLDYSKNLSMPPLTLNLPSLTIRNVPTTLSGGAGGAGGAGSSGTYSHQPAPPGADANIGMLEDDSDDDDLTYTADCCKIRKVQNEIRELKREVFAVASQIDAEAGPSRLEPEGTASACATPPLPDSLEQLRTDSMEQLRPLAGSPDGEAVAQPDAEPEPDAAADGAAAEAAADKSMLNTGALDMAVCSANETECNQTMQVDGPSEAACDNMKLDSDGSTLKDTTKDDLLNNELLKLLECPVCLEWIEPPVSQCRRGHLLCRRCCVRLRACPVCRSTFTSVRNRAMDEVADKLRYPCRYQCGLTMRLAARARHESNCLSRAYPCLLPECADAPPLPYDRLLAHHDEKHAGLILTGSSHSYYLSLNNNHKQWLVRTHGQLFHVNLRVDSHAWAVNVYVIFVGPKRYCTKYFYNVRVVGVNSQRKLYYSRTTHSDLDNSTTAERKKDSFYISMDQAISFIKVKNKEVDIATDLLPLTVSITVNQEYVTDDKNVDD